MGLSVGLLAALVVAPASAKQHHHRRHSGHGRGSSPVAVSAWEALDATSYCQGYVTASGGAPYVGEVANDMWALGTEIEVSPPVFGLSVFRVEDRIGWGSEIDFYTPSCGEAVAFGRRVEYVRLLR